MGPPATGAQGPGLARGRGSVSFGSGGGGCAVHWPSPLRPLSQGLSLRNECLCPSVRERGASLRLLFALSSQQQVANDCIATITCHVFMSRLAAPLESGTRASSGQVSTSPLMESACGR